jgi:hypothetical protein
MVEQTDALWLQNGKKAQDGAGGKLLEPLWVARSSKKALTTNTQIYVLMITVSCLQDIFRTPSLLPWDRCVVK